jgi:hypothetical protein
MLITNVYEDKGVGGQVFLSPSAFEQQQEAWIKVYGFLGPHHGRKAHRFIHVIESCRTVAMETHTRYGN